MKHTRLTFAAFVVLMVGLGSSDSLRGIFSPVFSSHFALSATQLGLIVTVSYIGNLVFLLVGGNVIERFEKKKALLALTGIWMAALAVFAFTDNYYLLLAGMFCAMGASTLLNTTLNLVTPLLFASSPAFFVNLLFLHRASAPAAASLCWGVMPRISASGTRRTWCCWRWGPRRCCCWRSARCPARGRMARIRQSVSPAC